MTRILSRLQKDRLRSVCIKDQAQHEFNQWVQSRMSHMVWSGPCNSWCRCLTSLPQVCPRQCTHNGFIDKNDNGKIIVPWPGTVLHYYAATEIIRWEDFDLEYENPAEKYASFGNGVTAEGFVPDQFPWVIPPIQQERPEFAQSDLASRPFEIQGRFERQDELFSTARSTSWMFQCIIEIAGARILRALGFS